MRIYSHRGNIFGKDARENEPTFIKECLAKGYFVEVDLWHDGGRYFLGHDGPTFLIDLAEFDRVEVMFHLKTPHVPRLVRADAFAIENDPYVLTLRGLLWTNHGQEPTPGSVMCAPELVGDPQPLDAFVRSVQRTAAGICTDYPDIVRDVLDAR